MSLIVVTAIRHILKIQFKALYKIKSLLDSYEKNLILKLWPGTLQTYSGNDNTFDIYFMYARYVMRLLLNVDVNKLDTCVICQ